MKDIKKAQNFMKMMMPSNVKRLKNIEGKHHFHSRRNRAKIKSNI